MGPLVIITVLFFMSYGPLQWSATPALRRLIGPAFVVSYLVPLYVGIALPHAPVFLGAVFILFMATTRNRFDAGCRFIMLAMLLPQVVWRLAIGSLYLFDLTTLHVLAIATLVQCAIKPGRGAHGANHWTVEDSFVLVLYLILWIGGGRMPSASLFLREGISETLLVALPYLALRKSVRSSGEFTRLIACFAVASGILALFALYEATNGWTLFGMYRQVSDAAGMNKGLVQRGGALRAPATMTSALMLGVVLLAGLGAAFYSRRYVRQGWMLVGWGVVILGGMVMTQSRGNVALLPLSALIFCLQRKKYGFAAVIAIGAPLGFGILMAVANVSPQIGAFLNVGAEQQATRLTAGVYDYRQLLFQRGMEVAATHRWTGDSLSNVVNQLSDITQGQGIVDLVNTYLTLYLISGLAGMIPFFLLFGMIWWKLLAPRVRKLATPELSDMQGFAMATLAIIGVQLTFLSFIDRMPLCLILALVPARIAGIERIRLARSQKSAAVQPPESTTPPTPMRSLAPHRQPAQPSA